MLGALILYMSGRTYSLKSTPKDRFLRSFSWQFYLFSEFLPEICWEQVNEEIFSYFPFWCLTWSLNSVGLTSNKPTHCLLDYGDFNGGYYFGGSENPHVVLQKPMNPIRFIVWCGMWNEGIIVAYFFEN